MSHAAIKVKRNGEIVVSLNEDNGPSWREVTVFVSPVRERVRAGQLDEMHQVWLLRTITKALEASLQVAGYELWATEIQS